MLTETAQDRVERELHRTLDGIRVGLNRAEILVAALGAFHRQIPDYEPAFRNMQHMELNAHALISAPNGDSQ
jgi:hypothetical protein